MSEPHPGTGTASNVAAYRALEHARAPRERLFEDPYALRFLPPVHRLLVRAARLPALRRLVERYADGLVPGARTSALARTRLIDDWISEQIVAGARQVVILGAGFDCRALRLPALASLDVFEVDRPAMIAFKSEKLADVPRPRLRRIAVDFRVDDLGQRLDAAGYAHGVRTMFVWEGVTNYLDEGAVAAVFDFVARTSAPRSAIAFTYVHADAIRGRFDAPGLESLLAALVARGEPWTFGFLPDELPGFLAEHRLRLLVDLGAASYRRLYWPSFPERGAGYEFYHAALAEVPDAARQA